MRAQPFERHLSAAIAATFADHVPPIATIALWARGDIAPVYTLAAMRNPARRSTTLAWLAAVDPEPDSPRAVQAAKEALRQAHDPELRLAALALVPLTDPGVAEAARRLANRGGRRVLALRTGDEVAEPPDLERAYGLERAVLGASYAIHLAERGRDADARAALTAACAETSSEPQAGYAVLSAIRRLGAWSTDLYKGGEHEIWQWLAFLAGRAELAVAEDMLGANALGSLAAAALGAGRLADAWREPLSTITETSIGELYDEGLILHVERWCYRFGAALVGPQPHAAVTALIQAALVEAQEPARSLGAVLLDPDLAHDDDLRASRTRRLTRAVETAIADARPNARTLRRILLPARNLADLGAHADVRAALAPAEARWGPAPTWIEHDTLSRDTVIELLACAEGHALAALELSTNAHVMPDTVSRVCAGLVRDGHREAAAPLFERLLAEALSASAVARLVPTANALDPAGRLGREDAIHEALAALPREDDSARAWLADCDRQARRAPRARART